MSRAVKNSQLQTRSSRLELTCQEEPYWISLAPCKHLGYYRPADKGAGTWRCRLYDPETRRRSKHAIGTTDDFEDADGINYLNFNQAQEMAHEWFRGEHHALTGEAPKQGTFTVTDAMDAYFKDCKRRGVKGLDRMECASKVHIVPAFGSVAVGKLTRTRIERWMDALASSKARVRTKHGKKQAYRPEPKTDDERRARKDTANRILSILKGALNHALDRRLVSTSGIPWQAVKPFRGTTKARVRFLSAEEQARLVNGSDQDFRRLVKAALYTGCRFGELVSLQVRDFGEEAGTVFIAESKSGKPRHIFLTDEAKAFFVGLVAGRAPDDLLFLHLAFDGRQWKLPLVNRPWKRTEQSRPMQTACKAAGLEILTFHELRHSYASMLVNAGIPLAYIAAQLGHSDTRMVEKHYGHLAPNALAESIRKLAPVLGFNEPGKVVGLKIKTS
ncbi:MAG: site-specific integrase [Holophagaceae bacterium]|nr:site-specific integrase [Holophagaceae bacterium]